MASTSKPRNRAGLSHFRGHAGEMYVSAELMRRGSLAAMTARGSRSFDILARRADRPVFTAIRVKTGHGSFLWNAKKDGTIFLDMTDTRDFTVIVDLPDTGTPIYYVIPTTVVERELSQLQATWLRMPGKNGRPHSPTDRTRCVCLDEDTARFTHGYAVKWAEYRDAWKLLDE